MADVYRSICLSYSLIKNDTVSKHHYEPALCPFWHAWCRKLTGIFGRGSPEVIGILNEGVLQETAARGTDFRGRQVGGRS